MLIPAIGRAVVPTVKVSAVPTKNVGGLAVAKLGASRTVRVAVVVAVPTPFEKDARYLCPVSAAPAMKEYVEEVAPEILTNAPVLSVRCHCTLGVGVPVEAAVNVT